MSFTQPMIKTNQIFTLMERKNLYHQFEDLSEKDKDILKWFLVDERKSRPCHEADEADKAGGEEWSRWRDMDDILAYLAGSGLGKQLDLPWAIERIRDFEEKNGVRVDQLSHLKPSSEFHSSSFSSLDTALLARDRLKEAISSAYKEILKARAHQTSAFAAGLRADRQNKNDELADRVDNIGTIDISEEQSEELDIGGGDSHSDFSQFAAGYGLTPEALEHNPDLLESTVGLWKDFGSPEMDEAFIKGFIFSMLE